MRYTPAIALSLCVLASPRTAHPEEERALVSGAIGHHAVLVGGSGGTFLIETSSSCALLPERVGREVVIKSPAGLLGPDARLALSPELECLVVQAVRLDLQGPPTPSTRAMPTFEELTTAIHGALDTLGYHPGRYEGGPRTKGIDDALDRFRRAKRISEGGKGGRIAAVLALGEEVARMYPKDPATQEIARTIRATSPGWETAALRAARTETAQERPHAGPTGPVGCEAGHWINSVLDGGKLVKLEDGTLWRVSSLDTIDSMLWLPTESITACESTLINWDSKNQVEARRLR